MLMIFVTLSNQKFKTPWRWCGYIETCRSNYVIYNNVDTYMLYSCWFGW